MTTLSADKRRDVILGEVNEIPVIAAEIIYEGAAVGIIKASGHAWPLAFPNKFAGFAEQKCDNSAGAAAAKNVRVISKGVIQLLITGAVITDVGLPVYATDDDTFSFTPVAGVFIGMVRRFVSSGIVEVEFDAIGMQDPWEGRVAEALAASTKTLDIQDSGKIICCTVTTVITIPATATKLDVVLYNVGPYGTVEISASPNSSDKIQGPDVGGTDDHDYVNTLATAQRGDFIHLINGDSNGGIIAEKRGVWATA